MGERGGTGPLTVGLVHWALPPTIGGVESHLADYIKLLSDAGVKVVVFSGEPDPSQHVRKYAAEVETHDLLRLRGGRNSPVPPEGLAKELATWLGDKVAEHGVQVLHGHNLHYFSPVPAAAINIVAREQGIPRHHTFHNAWRDAGGIADLVSGWEGRWANSEFVARECLRYRGAKPNATYLGIDAGRFHDGKQWRPPLQGRKTGRDASPDTAPVILQPARLLRWKGSPTTVEMLRILHANGVKARLVLTDTPHLIDWDEERTALRRDLEETIGGLGLTSWVTFTPASYDDMPALYADADVVVNPSRGEPLGLVPLEAMAAGRPVMITKSGGMRETFRRSSAGAIVADNSRLAENLAEAVESFLTNPKAAIEAGTRGRRHVAERFDMDRYVEAMCRHYQESIHSVQAGRIADADRDVERSRGAETGTMSALFSLRTQVRLGFSAVRLVIVMRTPPRKRRSWREKAFDRIGSRRSADTADRSNVDVAEKEPVGV